MKNIKGIILGIIIGILLVGCVSFAATLVTGNVYINPFKILLNGKEYTPVLPILNYAERTYVPLRELATLTGNKVDFKDGKIIINNKENSELFDKLLGDWEPKYAEDYLGNNVELHYLWGSGGYAGSLTFNSDYTYTDFVGIYSEEDCSGIFEIKDNERIELCNKYNSKSSVYIENDSFGQMCIVKYSGDTRIFYYKVS